MSDVARRRWGTHLARRRLFGAGAALSLVLWSVVGMAIPAQAVPTLVSSSPAAGSTVTTFPDYYVLTFDTAVDLLTSDIEVYDPTGFNIRENPLGHDSGNSSTLALSNHIPNGPCGSYLVIWRAVSLAGETVTGSYTFTYSDGSAGCGGGSAPEPVPVPVETPVAVATSSASPSAVSTPVPKVTTMSTATAELGSTTVITVIGSTALAIGVLSGVAIVLYLLIRRARSGD